MTADREPRTRPRHVRRHPVRRIVLVVAAVLVLAGLGTAWALTSTADDAASATPVVGPPIVPVTELVVRRGVVTAVPDGHTVVVDSRDTVQVIGLRAPVGGECGADQSVDHARGKLLGQRVTLVPDPDAPAAGQHVVLASQLSYTDEALMAGMARVADGTYSYGGVFRREERDAAGQGEGLWATGACWSADR